MKFLLYLSAIPKIVVVVFLAVDFVCIPFSDTFYAIQNNKSSFALTHISKNKQNNHLSVYIFIAYNMED